MTTTFKHFTFFIALILSSTSWSQDSGDDIFNNDLLHEVRFTFTQNNFWQTLVNNFEFTANGEKVPYLQGTVMIDGVIVDSVGVRFKGFTSYQFESDKKPIKIDFNEYVPGKRYDGLRKLNLNNATGDPSMQRDVVCYEMMRNLGIKAPRTSYSRVYFNDQYWGIYQNIEQVDKEFLQNNFTNDDGNLFKNKGWSHFEWLGFNDAAYHPPFELKTNKENPDWTGFVDLMNILNNSSDVEFKKEIEDIFNVDLFLKTLAVDVATNNWDAYIEHGRNWYIYQDTVSNIFHWIPWDYNFSLGGGSFGGGFDECIVFSEFIAEQDGTTKVKFHDIGFATEMVTWTWDFGDGETSMLENPIHEFAAHNSYTVCLKVYFDDNCQDEFCNVVDTNYNPGDCASIQNGSCPHPPGLPFQQTINWIPECCTDWNMECEDLYGFLSTGNGGFGSTDFTIDQRNNEGVLINRLLNNSEFNERYYTQVCDLMQNFMIEAPLFDLIDHNKELIIQAVQEDPNFLFTYEEFLEDISDQDVEKGIKGVLSERINSLKAELDTIFNCPENQAELDLNEIVINEFMASNSEGSGIADMSGEHDDWIELHNTTNASVNISGLYLSDDPTDLKKWQIPYGTRMAPKGYAVVWCDGDSIQFGRHASFKLQKTGGEILLSNADETIIDQVSFGEQTTNISSARIPNGSGPFVMQAATFNYNNENTSSTKEAEVLQVNIFPNPASSVIYIESDEAEDMFVRLYNNSGQLVYSRRFGNTDPEMNISGLANGLYFIHMKTESGKRHQQKVIVMHD